MRPWVTPAVAQASPEVLPDAVDAAHRASTVRGGVTCGLPPPRFFISTSAGRHQNPISKKDCIHEH